MRVGFDAVVEFERRGGDDSDRPLAVVRPGGGYPALGPVLHRTCKLLVARGWRLAVVSWSPTVEAPRDPLAYVEGAIRTASAGERPALLVAKSFGTHGASWAAAQQVPGIRWTPLTTEPGVREALRRMDERSIAIGGSADPSWQRGAFDGVRTRILEVPGADHSIELPSWEDSIEAQSAVLRSIDAHLRRLTPAG